MLPMTCIERSLQDALAALLGTDPARLSRSATFDELGVDSLIGLRFARKIEDLTGREVDPEWLYDYPTLDRFAAFLATQAAPGVTS